MKSRESVIQQSLMRRGLLSSLIVLIMSLGIMSQAAAKENETKIPAEGLTRIEVRFLNKNVRLMAWKDNVVTIISKTGGRVPVKKEGAVLQVGVKSWKSVASVVGDVLILLPEKMVVDVDVIDGNIEVQGFAERVRVKSMDGDIRVAACFGAVEVKTVGGKVLVQDIKGDVALQTVGGTIVGRNLKSTIIETKSVDGKQTIESSKVQQLRMKSHSGALRYEGQLIKEGKYAATTFGGKIDFRLTSNSAFDLEALSRFGRVDVVGQIPLSERTKNFARGTAKPGVASLSLSAFSGDIKVHVDDGGKQGF